jgi:hypothetical protein
MKRKMLFFMVLLVLVAFAGIAMADIEPPPTIEVEVINEPTVKAEQKGDWNVTVTNPDPIKVETHPPDECKRRHTIHETWTLNTIPSRLRFPVYSKPTTETPMVLVLEMLSVRITAPRVFRIRNCAFWVRTPIDDVVPFHYPVLQHTGSDKRYREWTAHHTLNVHTPALAMAFACADVDPDPLYEEDLTTEIIVHGYMIGTDCPPCK